MLQLFFDFGSAEVNKLITVETTDVHEPGHSIVQQRAETIQQTHLLGVEDRALHVSIDQNFPQARVHHLSITTERRVATG